MMKIQVFRIGYSEYVYRFKFGKNRGFSIHLDLPSMYYED